MNPSYFDNTKLTAYKECPRKYFIRHVLNWTVIGESTSAALVFGASWHAGQDAIWGSPKHVSTNELVDNAMEGFLKEWEESGYERNLSLDQQSDLGARTPGVAQEMYLNYVITRQKMIRDSEVLAIEQPVAMPLPYVQGVWYIGKFDKVVQFNGLHILEHKTTSQYAKLGNFRTDYVESWNVSSQVKGYEVLGTLYYPELQDVWCDLALVHNKIHDAFKFVPVAHQQELVLEWIHTTASWVKVIQQDTEKYKAQGNLDGAIFRKNEDSCYGKYGPCPFLHICSAIPDPTKLDGPPEGYVVEPWEPFETAQLTTALESAKKVMDEQKGLAETIKQGGV